MNMAFLLELNKFGVKERERRLLQRKEDKEGHHSWGMIWTYVL
jgi:hypothetical protein